MAAVSKAFREESAVRERMPTGIVVAALFATLVGLLTLAVVNIYSTISTDFSNMLKLNNGIGPYSGKEVLWLGGWFLGWIVLHFALRKRQLNLRKWFGAWLVGMAIATLLMYPPIFEFVAELF